jgi:4-hydroxybenzoate polyprenyltransferase
MLLAITAGVATWVAGFDIFYALPDEGFDRAHGLRSAAVRLGEARAILLAKALHGLTIPALAAFGYAAEFGLWYYAGLVVAAGILVYEHRLVHAGDLSRLNAAFFTMNGVMSMVVFGFALLDRMVT